MGESVFCKWERERYPAGEFTMRGSAEVHMAAGDPLHTSAGRLFERGDLEFPDGRVVDPDFPYDDGDT